MKENKVGDTIIGKVSGITKYGLFFKFDNGYSGMVHISEVSDRFISDLKKIFVLDETINVKILEINQDEKKYTLSIRQLLTENRRRKEIPESGRGFEPLKENLDKWVKNKLEDIKNGQ